MSEIRRYIFPDDDDSCIYFRDSSGKIFDMKRYTGGTRVYARDLYNLDFTPISPKK